MRSCQRTNHSEQTMLQSHSNIYLYENAKDTAMDRVLRATGLTWEAQLCLKSTIWVDVFCHYCP